jgi:hypothetical protein
VKKKLRDQCIDDDDDDDDDNSLSFVAISK